MEIKNNILVLRKNKQMSQRALAQAVGVTPELVYKYEAGKIFDPSFSLALKFSAVFDVPVQEIFFPADRTKILNTEVQP